MATAGKNLSAYSPEETPSAFPYKFGVVVSEWNNEITSNLADGAVSTLKELGAATMNIHTHMVPGSFELPTAARLLIQSGEFDAIIAIGSVIQGETRHFEFVCEATAKGIMDVSTQTGVPVIFCVLTDDNMEQAQARSGGKHGNKGVEAAVAAVKMAALRKKLL